MPWFQDEGREHRALPRSSVEEGTDNEYRYTMERWMR